MAEWNSKELSLPEEFDVIAQNAQNAINNVDTLLSIVKQAGDVAKLFLMLSNPAGMIIRVAANEIIKLCNDFKEIGAFWLLINPMDKQYGNLNPTTYGLKIAQDSNGLYQFYDAVYEVADDYGGGKNVSIVGEAYQKTISLENLSSNYRDSNGRKKGSTGFIPPMPIFDNPPHYELGGYDPATWDGELPTVPKLANGIFPPQMTPSQCLRIMSEAFDDEGDVAIYEINETHKNKQYNKLYTASGAAVDMGSFNIDLPQTERIFKEPAKSKDIIGLGKVDEMNQRGEITTLVSSGKPNFAGSSNIQGIETIAIIALVGVADFQSFVDAFKNLNKLFGGAPELGKLVKELEAVSFAATEEGKDKITVTNNTKYGAWEEGDYIFGQNSGAGGQITKIAKTTEEKRTRTDLQTVYDDDAIAIAEFPRQTDLDPDSNWKRVDLIYKKHGTVNFQAGELIFEGQQVPDKETQRNLFAGRTDESLYPKTYNITKRRKEKSAIDPSVKAKDVDPSHVPKYGEVIGIDTSAPESVHPNFSSIKIKDMIPGYAGFFDEIIQFAEGLKSFADGADTYIAILIRMIDKYIEYFEEIANKIKAFLKIFADGLPAQGIYWLTIKTYGGNKAIQSAITSSENQPSDDLKFCAGFAMVSVSGMGGLSATKGLELLFGQNGFGLEFQEVAPIPEESELDTAILTLQTQYDAATAAQAELATDVFDALGLNPPVSYRNATTINLTDWNSIPPDVGDFVLGMTSGCFGQVLAFTSQTEGRAVLVLDHIKIGPTIAGTNVDEERKVRQLDVTSDTYIEFPYDGSIPTSTETAFDATPALALPLVGEGVFEEEVVKNRSSHKPNGLGTTLYEPFQGNENTFIAVEDTEERIEALDLDWIMKPEQPFNTFQQERKMKQQVFKVIDGSFKEPVLTTGHNGKYGYFTTGENIISFNEEKAQIFLADIEGRNAEEDRITRLKPPPGFSTADRMSLQAVTGDISLTGKGGEVGSYALAMDNKPDKENLPE